VGSTDQDRSERVHVADAEGPTWAIRAECLDVGTNAILAEIPAPDQAHPEQVHYPGWQRVAP
jgi:hypothetical protein